MAGVGGAPRIDRLDAMRGIAVIGILAAHAAAFSMPAQAYFNPAAYGGTDPANLAAWATVFILFEGKMRGLFTLLFGASLLLAADGAEARGEDSASPHRRRMMWLLLFGILHFYLIWWGDILIQLALVGLVAYSFRKLPARRLIRWSAVLFLVHMLAMAGFAASYLYVAHEASLPLPLPDKVSDWAVMSPPFAPLPPDKLAADLALFRGDYGGIVRHRLLEQGLLPLQTLIMGGIETLAFMLLGMAGVKSGFLTGAWPRSRYRRIAVTTLATGGTGSALLAALLIAEEFHPAAIFSVLFCGTFLFRVAMTIGYAAAIAGLLTTTGRLAVRLIAAGRAALTNYIGTSIVMALVFYGPGLGLYGSLSRLALIIPTLLGAAAILAWSRPWLERYRQGPLEWLLRSLVRGRARPLRLQARAA